MIRVMLVDDQTLVREGVRSLLALASDIEVVGEASDGAEALVMVPQIAPDVLLLDLRMPNTLILTTFDDDELVLGGIEAGAKGYLLKDVALNDLLDAVRSLAAGQTLVNPAITDRLLKGLKKHITEFSALETPEPMTQRETEILRLMAGGYSNKEIARALDVAEGTIKNHVSNILSKMGVRDRTRAVLKAIEAGLI
jgi:DNA-binding NarL/FixJ family response regulator